METKELSILVWDSQENFYDKSTQAQLGFSNGNQGVYKKVVLVNSEIFEQELNKLEKNEKFILICHVSQTKDFEVYYSFINSITKTKFKTIKAIYVSKGNSGEVMQKLFKDKQISEKIITYKSLKDEIISDEIIPQTTNDINKENIGSENLNQISVHHQKCSFAIITALYEEFEDIKELFNWIEPYRTNKKEYKIGTLKGKDHIKVVASIPPKTGMVDSAIIATQMLEIFKPNYLLMSGVCGGKKGTKLGDIVLASSVFTFQKGKLSDLRDDEGKIIELYDEHKQKIDLSKVTDVNGKPIEITVELFEKENEGQDIDPLLRDLIEPNLKKIHELINSHTKVESNKIDIHFEPMACSSMVINKNGFFDKRIKSTERKTAAVEMESYGVARACVFANDGNTKFIIFKSVMDNTVQKDDLFKKQAAYNSAQFLKHLLESEILK